jgi:hypothetical protein
MSKINLKYSKDTRRDQRKGTGLMHCSSTKMQQYRDAGWKPSQALIISQQLVACLLILFAVCGNQSCIYAQHTSTIRPEWYIGTNPVAIPLGFSIKPEAKRFLPIAAGNEYGANLAGGYFFRPHQSIEGRLSLSNVHQVAFVGQFHVGTNYFLQKNKIEKGMKGWYVGGYVRYWDFFNKQTGIHFHSISPYLSLGYMKAKNRFLFDFRLNQTLAAYSWSSLEYTRAGADWMLSPWPEFIRVLPTLTCTISYTFRT